MKRKFSSLAFAMVLLCALAAMQPTALSQSSEPMKEDSRGAYESGRYRNLLKEEGHSDAEIQKRIDWTFQQLFHGDAAGEAIYYSSGKNADGPLAYITDVANHDVRTEGMSYGMMVAVQTNHKAEFDAIWNWANTYMLITDNENPSVGYYAWSMNLDGTPRSDSPAPDGEEYFVMSLYFAAHRWRNGKGIYNYTAQADRILSLMRHHSVKTGTGPFRIHPGELPFQPQWKPTAKKLPYITSVGPMVDEEHGMIAFVPGSGGNAFSDPSYHLPAFYELWALWGPQEDRAFWKHAADVSRVYFTKATNSATGLAPDYANFDGTPRVTPFNPASSTFSYDSWRTASNWSVDQSWWGRNASAGILSDRIQTFLWHQGIDGFADRFTLEGQPLSNRHSTGLVSTTAVASLAATNTPQAQAFVQELWDTPIPKGEQRYYDGLLYMMSLLHISGRFRVW